MNDPHTIHNNECNGYSQETITCRLHKAVQFGFVRCHKYVLQHTTFRNNVRYVKVMFKSKLFHAGKTYRQKLGLLMGPSLSPLVADFYGQLRIKNIRHPAGKTNSFLV